MKAAVPVGSTSQQSVPALMPIACLPATRLLRLNDPPGHFLYARPSFACFGLFPRQLPECFLEAGAGEGGDLVNGAVSNNPAVIDYDDPAADGLYLLHDMC